VTSLEPPQNTEIVAEGSVFSYFWITWFRTIWSILGYQNCRTEAFVPVTTGITYGGVQTISANYNVFRNRFSFSVDITDTVSITGLVGATIDLKNLNRFTLLPINNGYCIVSDLVTNLPLGTGVINNGIAYLPAFTGTEINISGFYLIEETK
jgi:hypothetical protein